jgi:hypothetical protein
VLCEIQSAYLSQVSEDRLFRSVDTEKAFIDWLSATDMGCTLSRRRLIRLLGALVVPVSGCLNSVGIGGEPENIPLEVENRSSQTQPLFVEFAESDTGDVLLSESSEIEPDATHEFEVGPIDAQTQYAVSYEIGDKTGDDSVSGSGLRSVQIEITENESVEIYYTMT